MSKFNIPMSTADLPRHLHRFYSEVPKKVLDETLFPDHPELYAAISSHRQYGIPEPYWKTASTTEVNPRRVFFESNLGKQYTGNPRYIYEEMRRRYPDFDYIWCYSGTGDIPGNPTIIKERRSDAYHAALATCGLVINNTVFPSWFLRAETFYLQTWHGTPLKKLHWDVDVRKKKSSPDFFVKSRGWSALLSPNAYATQKFKSCFRYDGSILETGYPANDIFSQPERYAATRARVRAKLGLTQDAQKLVLYAPTWRDGSHLGNNMFKFDLFLDLDTALEQTPDTHVFAIRAHHMSAAGGLAESFTEAQRRRIIDVSMWDDAVELMCAADILVTDYSSIVYDWACSRKPMVYFVPDFERYETTLRGMYYDINDLKAGPITRTTTALCQALLEVGEGGYTPDPVFAETFCKINDGGATDRVIGHLEKNALGLLPPDPDTPPRTARGETRALARQTARRLLNRIGAKRRD